MIKKINDYIPCVIKEVKINFLPLVKNYLDNNNIDYYSLREYQSEIYVDIYQEINFEVILNLMRITNAKDILISSIKNYEDSYLGITIKLENEK